MADTWIDREETLCVFLSRPNELCATIMCDEPDDSANRLHGVNSFYLSQPNWNEFWGTIARPTILHILARYPAIVKRPSEMRN